MLKQLKQLFSRAAPQPEAPPAPTGATVRYDAWCTRLEVPQPAFPHILHGQRDLVDPDLLDDLNTLCGELLQRGDGRMSADKYHVLLHLQRVQHHVVLSVGVDDLASLHGWAQAANAVLLDQDGVLRDPQGRVLVGRNGKPEAGADVPYPPAALARKAATGAALAARGIAVPDTLPPLVCEDELLLRDRDEVIGRARALLVVALRAESVASDEAMSSEILLSKVPLAEGYLSPKELVFLAKETPPKQDYAQLLWRYESLYVLAWALGLVDDLPFPEAPIEAAALVAKVIEMKSPALRPAGEILDALDATYRIHWHVRQQRLKKKNAAIAGIDPDVVMERHHALNWLVRFQHAGWDEVDTPT